MAELESHYPPETVHTAIFICPMHPLDRHLKPEEKCTLCRMALARRHIPASGVWEKPGEPSIKMTVLSNPLAHFGSSNPKSALGASAFKA